VLVYREAAPHVYRPGWYIHDWESLGKALEVQTGMPGYEESLAKLGDFREDLLAWGRRWNLAHPEPLGWAMENLRVWAKVPEVARKPVVYTGPLVNIPPFPPFRPPEFSPPIYGSKKLGSWSEVEKELRQAFESWLRECRAQYEEWALHKRDLLKHARWWVAHRVKRWPIRNLHQRARKEGFLRVLLDLDPRDVKKEGVPCGKIVSTPFTILTRKPFWWLPTSG
jgi:hypothetical protein